MQWYEDPKTGRIVYTSQQPKGYVPLSLLGIPLWYWGV